MKNFSVNIRLLLVFAFLLAETLIVHFFFTRSNPLRESGQMDQAASRAGKWFRVIQKEKGTLGIRSDVMSAVPNRFMLGDDYSPLTTTLGSLNAKEISTNPDFAALMVRLLHEAGCGQGDKAGLIISGSFPALAVSTLAALQTMEMEVVMMSSLGASSFGANQAGATWIDMENWLIREGGLGYSSVLVSAGAENDRGEGLTEEGRKMIRDAAERNHKALYKPDNLLDAIHYKLSILEKGKICVLINIGGNQTALGSCAHASTIPNGLHQHLKLCNHQDRGIIQEMNARGIPVINLLNIMEMASNYGIDPAPGTQYAKSSYLYTERETSRGVLAVILCLGILAIGLFLCDLKRRP